MSDKQVEYCPVCRENHEYIIYFYAGQRIKLLSCPMMRRVHNSYGVMFIPSVQGGKE